MGINEGKQPLNIKVVIADRSYPMEVSSADEEERVRRAARMVNDKFNAFKQEYAGEAQDFLAMCALLVTIDYLKTGDNKAASQQEIEAQLNALEQQLDRQLESG